MVEKTFKINLKVPNKLLYSILAIILVIGISAVVYAFNTNDPATFGHSAGELDGVCKSDGSGCQGVSATDERIEGSVEGMYINEDKKLCYKYEKSVSAGCTYNSVTCTETGTTTTEGVNYCSATLSSQNSKCLAACKLKEACDGDDTLLTGCTGFNNVNPLTVNYALGSKTSCEAGTGHPSEDKLYCSCRVTGVPYNTEVASNPTTEIDEKCILGA